MTPSPRLPALRRWSVYAVAAALWASGAAWVVAHFLLTKQGEYGPQKSPLEGWSLVVHGGAAMAALWTLGLLWAAHVQPGWSRRRGRWTGGVLLGAALVLSVTGYGLYYLGDEGLRDLTSWAHWLLGLAAPAAFLLHRFTKKPPTRAKPKSPAHPGECRDPD